MSVLLLADVHEGQLSDSTHRAVRAARAMGDSLDLLIVGEGVAHASQAASRLEGVTRVLVADHAVYAHLLAERVAPLLVHLVQQQSYDVILASTSSIAKDILPRVAALLDVMQISDITKVLSPDTFERPIYAGNAIETVQSKDLRKVITIRTSAFPPASIRPANQHPAPITPLDHIFESSLSTFVSQEMGVHDRPDLTSAKIVISGGRALQSAENFETYLFPLAQILGAAVGASRAAVDAGYAPNDWQVGQTGKVVAPHLYIAIGISGAIQHLAGIKDSKVIVAINKDPEAPIFHIADYGLVADLFSAVPELIQALQERLR